MKMRILSKIIFVYSIGIVSQVSQAAPDVRCVNTCYRQCINRIPNEERECRRVEAEYQRHVAEMERVGMPSRTPPVCGINTPYSCQKKCDSQCEPAISNQEQNLESELRDGRTEDIGEYRGKGLKYECSK